MVLFASKFSCKAALLLPSLVVASVASVIDNGKLVTLGSISYYVGGPSVSRIDPPGYNANHSNADVLPMTVIRTDETLLTGDILQDTISNYSMSDDVFQYGFLKTIFLIYDGDGQGKIDPSIQQALNRTGNEAILSSHGYQPLESVKTAQMNRDIPKGPYFFSPSTGEIYQAFRLYSDHQLAFTQAAISDGNSGYKPLPAAAEGAMTKSVAVPSRLYYTPTAEKPLLGLRLGVKDIFDLKGLRTSGGNRAFHDLYPERNVTAPAIQLLIDAGAIVVGKMGTVQFANGDHPTADWVDFHCPFNPRGDGYQYPGGSSTGPGAGIAAYSWLDIAVGSDTGGSMRSPAKLQGVYGNRPSTGAVALDNAIPLCHALDTAGVFARDAVTWSRVMHSWYPNFTDYRKYPKRIFYPQSQFLNTSTDAGILLENFVAKLENFLDTRREPVDLRAHWKETHPSEAPDDINQLLNTTYAVLTAVDQYRSLSLPFFADYAEKHDGRRPFINPGPLLRWNWGQEMGGDAAYEEALKNKTTFENWWSSEKFGKGNKETCSEGIYIYPSSKGETEYRNVYRDAPPSPPVGFHNVYIAVMARTPDLVVPVGEIPYNSTVTLKTEHIPVAVSLVAARGCDFMLVNLIEDLEKAGVLKPVSTGSMMYP